MPERGAVKEHNAAKLSDRIIVCGMGQCGYRVVRLLLRLGEPVTVLALEMRDDWTLAVVTRQLIHQ